MSRLVTLDLGLGLVVINWRFVVTEDIRGSCVYGSIVDGEGRYRSGIRAATGGVGGV